MKAHFYPVSSTLVQLVVLSGLAFSAPAHAVDGCKLLLCMAGNWKSIPDCVPPVHEALRDVARGRVWPHCGMAGSSGSANQFVAPVQCPEQYRFIAGFTRNGDPRYGCPYSGVIHVAVEGEPWLRTWWSRSGETVVEWLPAARSALANSPGGLDDQFDSDHAAWLVAEQARLAAEAAAAAAGGGG